MNNSETDISVQELQERRAARQMEEEQEEQLLNEQYAHVENEIVQLLRAAKRAVDKAYNIKGYHMGHSSLVSAALLARIEKVKLDVLEELTESLHSSYSR